MLLDSPWAFGASPEDDKGLDLAHLATTLAGETHAVFAIEAPSAPDQAPRERELIASTRVLRRTSPTFRHRATIWGVFVEPGRRGRGYGRAVTEAAVSHARTWPVVDYVDLRVNAAAPVAPRLYESPGFEAWEREPEATEVGGLRYDEIHMPLRLRVRGDE